MTTLKLLKFFGFFLVIIFTQACTSLVEKGDKLYEAGDFTGAAAFYERALSRNPENTEARIALSQTREKIIDRGLIDVRMLRLAANQAEATIKLEEMLRNQALWQIVAKGAVAGTQAEELRFALPWYKQEARRLAKGSHPDAFRWHLYSFEYLIRAGKLHAFNETFSDSILGKGHSKCIDLAKNVKGQRFFLKAFVKRYCASWEMEVRLSVDPVDDTRFNQIETLDNLNFNSPEYRTQLSNVKYQALNALKSSFSESSWYSEQAKTPLKIKLDGSFFYRRHSERVKREIRYPAVTTYIEKNAQGEEVKRKEEVTRKHQYWARVFHEEMRVNLSMNTSVLSKPIIGNIHDSERRSSDSHNEHFEAADLHPVKAKLMNIDAVFSRYMQDLNRAILDDLEAKWVTIYCHSNLDANAGETHLRCAKAKPDDNTVNAWFNQRFGLRLSQLKSLYPNL